MEVSTRVHSPPLKRLPYNSSHLSSGQRVRISHSHGSDCRKIEPTQHCRALAKAFADDVTNTFISLTKDTSTHIDWQWLNTSVYRDHIHEMVAGFEAIFNKSDVGEPKDHDAKKRSRMRKLPQIVVGVMNNLERSMSWRALTIINWLSCMSSTRTEKVLIQPLTRYRFTRQPETAADTKFARQNEEERR